MGLINRFLLLVFSVGVAAVSLVVAAVFFQILPESMWLNEVRYALKHWQTLAGCAAFFLFSLYFLNVSCYRGQRERSRKDVIVLKGAAGEAAVAVTAIASLIERTAAAVPGVASATAKVHSLLSPDGVNRMRIELSLLTERRKNISIISDVVQSGVRQEIKETLGITDEELNLAVTEITDDTPDKKRRVR